MQNKFYNAIAIQEIDMGEVVVNDMLSIGNPDSIPLVDFYL
jgi:hypothetical protein